MCHKLYLQKANVSPTYLFLINHDIPVDQYIVEQEELSWLWFLPAHFRQDPFAHQDSAGYRERLQEEHSQMSRRYHQPETLEKFMPDKFRSYGSLLPDPNRRSSFRPSRYAWHWPRCLLKQIKPQGRGGGGD